MEYLEIVQQTRRLKDAVQDFMRRESDYQAEHDTNRYPFEYDPVLDKHVYEVGIGSDQTRIQAPSACAAAMYYNLYLVHSNVPTLAMVYSQDGQPFDAADCWWVSLDPSVTHIQWIADRIKAQLPYCQEVKES